MTMYWREQSGREYLHCRLQNTSGRTLEVDSSGVLWATPGLFDFTAISAEGKILYKSVILQSLQAEPQPVAIAPGQAIEGDIDLKYIPVPTTARSQDLLLMWKHGVHIVHGAASGAVSGVTYLPKRGR